MSKTTSNPKKAVTPRTEKCTILRKRQKRTLSRAKNFRSRLVSINVQNYIEPEEVILKTAKNVQFYGQKLHRRLP